MEAGALVSELPAQLIESLPSEDMQTQVGLVTRRHVDETPLPRLFLVSIALITVGGFLVRLPSFHDSLFGDEISTYFIVSGHSLSRVLRLVESNQETSPPLYFILAWATKGLLSSPAQSIRLVSLITGTAAIPLTFLLGLWTVGRRAALVGATCVALSPYMIFYSTEARPFMLMLFFTLLSTLALLRALDSGKMFWWVAYAVCSCGAVYTHYVAVFLLVVQLAWAFWTQPQVRRAPDRGKCGGRLGLRTVVQRASGGPARTELHQCSCAPQTKRRRHHSRDLRGLVILTFDPRSSARYILLPYSPGPAWPSEWSGLLLKVKGRGRPWGGVRPPATSSDRPAGHWPGTVADPLQLGPN